MTGHLRSKDSRSKRHRVGRVYPGDNRLPPPPSYQTTFSHQDSVTLTLVLLGVGKCLQGQGTAQVEARRCGG